MKPAHKIKSVLQLVSPGVVAGSNVSDNLYELAFNNTVQANIISIASSGKIIMANNAACKLFGYSKKELLTKKRPEIFDINETGFKKMLRQRKNAGKSVALITVIDKRGRLIPCEISSAIFVDDNNVDKAITSITDMSQAILRQNEIDITNRNGFITEYEADFKLVFDSSSDVLCDVDILAGTIILNQAHEKKFGYSIKGNKTALEDWFSHIHPSDRKEIVKDYKRMLVSVEMEWRNSFRFLAADDAIFDVITGTIVLRHADGKAYRMIGYIHDTGEQKELEKKLQYEIRLKEKQIEDAAKDAKDTERSEIAKELHDNVNQLLGASRLYLEMAKKGGENMETNLARSSEYTLTAIEEIRKLTKGLSTDIIKNLGLCEAIGNFTKELMDMDPIMISSKMDRFAESAVNDKFKLNVFRIVQEHLNNIIKHAKATKVVIRLLGNKQSILLHISDNGIGFDTGKTRMGIGIDNIKSRAKLYNGNAEFVSQPGHGCFLNVTFPVKNTLASR